MRPTICSGIGLLSCLWCFTVFGSYATTEMACGDRLTAPRGVIQTPNFPGPFPVPIKCRWLIDVSDIPATNSSIVVYLTQVYVYKGLSFTEYAYYESESTNFGATLLKEITEGNVFEYRWFRTFRPYLVVEFELDRLEGNHVRVLNDLLDVYGFNVTYQMTEDEPNSGSCSVQACSFTGNCLISEDYASFRCDCFEGFSGRDCNEGPLCFNDKREPVCQNGATCRQIGAEAMNCHCPDGYVGDHCEIQLLDGNNDCGTENCIMQCPYDEEDRQPCACKNGTKIYNYRSRYQCRMKLSNVTSLRATLAAQHDSLCPYVTKQIICQTVSSWISQINSSSIFVCLFEPRNQNAGDLFVVQHVTDENNIGQLFGRSMQQILLRDLHVHMVQRRIHCDSCARD